MAIRVRVRHHPIAPRGLAEMSTIEEDDAFRTVHPVATGKQPPLAGQSARKEHQASSTVGMMWRQPRQKRVTTYQPQRETPHTDLCQAKPIGPSPLNLLSIHSTGVWHNRHPTLTGRTSSTIVSSSAVTFKRSYRTRASAIPM